MILSPHNCRVLAPLLQVAGGVLEADDIGNSASRAMVSGSRFRLVRPGTL